MSAESLGAPSVDVLAAYRAELSQHPGRATLSCDDGEWLVIGSLLGHATSVARTQRETLLSMVRQRVRGLLGEETWTRGSPTDPYPPTDEALGPRIRLLCERIEDAGWLVLADALLNAYLLSADDVEGVERARYVAMRARLAWKRGDLDAATAQYSYVSTQATVLAAPELDVRAAIGFAVLARLRGNLPASREAAAHAMTIAERHQLLRLAALAHHALMVLEATSGDWNEAVQHAWATYRYVRGDITAEATQLADLAQLFYDMGHFEVAQAAFSVALQHTLPKHLLLPALGGAALTAARQGDAATVVACAERSREQGDPTMFSYAVAACWLDIAEAYLIVDRRLESESFRIAALELASTAAFHELEHRAEHLTAPPRHPFPQAVAISAMSREIGRTVRELTATV